MQRIYSVTIKQRETSTFQYEVSARDESEAEELAWDKHSCSSEFGSLLDVEAEVADIVEGGEYDNEDK